MPIIAPASSLLERNVVSMGLAHDPAERSGSGYRPNVSSEQTLRIPNGGLTRTLRV